MIPVEFVLLALTLLAHAVGVGGSMIWFGSSSGVALSNRFPRTPHR